jgi:hypothetical protein
MAQVFAHNSDRGDERLMALISTLATLPDEWALLCARRIGDDGRHTVDAVLVHARIGIALIDLAPGDPGGAVGALDEYLANEGFADYFPGELPIVALSVALDDIVAIGDCLAAAFDAGPRLSIDDPDWADAMIELLLVDGEMAVAEPVHQEPPLATGGVSAFDRDGDFDAKRKAAVVAAPPATAPVMQEARKREPYLSAALIDEKSMRRVRLVAEGPAARTYRSTRRRGRFISAAAVIGLILGLGAGAWQLEPEDAFIIRSAALEAPGAARWIATTPASPQLLPPPFEVTAMSFAEPPPSPPMPTRVEPLPQPQAPQPIETTAATARVDSTGAPSLQAAASPKPQRLQHKPRRVAEGEATPRQLKEPQRNTETAEMPGARAPAGEHSPSDAADLPPLEAAAGAAAPVPNEVPPHAAQPTSGGSLSTAPASVEAPTSSNCRAYTAQTSITGRNVPVRGVACRGPDGQWRMVSEASTP